ncbi:MAG TPA: CRTAC1 family protein [Thermoanaerobaculia bacterium]|nr:CRTAC1 family protein [Thermoanaerobaculia bacterium]
MIVLVVGSCTTDRSATDEGSASATAVPRPEGADPAVVLVEVGEELGLRFVHHAGSTTEYALPAIMGGGAAVFDADGDGRLDVYLIAAGDSGSAGAEGSGTPNRLFLQREDGRFVDATSGSGLGDRGYGMGCAVGDIDNDGDIDVYVTNWGEDELYRNRGDGTFEKVTKSAGVATSGLSMSATFLDYDRDGYLDLYVTRYVRFDPGVRCIQDGARRDFCGPMQFAGESDVLYRNLGGGRFADVSREAGIRSLEDAGLGVIAADFDDDGWIDVYVANDADPNHLWMNQGDGTFVEEGLLMGAALNRFGEAEAGMGVVAGDADGDGDLDLFVTHLYEESNTFYENDGIGGFLDATVERGLAMPSVSYTGFGVALVDLDNDTDLDLAIVNGAVKRRPASLSEVAGWWAPYAEPNQLMLNQGNGRYLDASADCGTFCSEVEVSRGLIAADIDADGDLDLLVTNLEGPVRLYRNQGTGEEPGKLAWLQIRVLDPALRREALGAKVTVVTATRELVRHATPIGGYLTSGPAQIHVGLGAEEEVRRIEVRWPTGEREHFAGGPARRVVELNRGEGVPPAQDGTGS